MYSFTSRVRYSECDGDLRLTIPNCINYLQDCSMFHCEHLGRGFSYCTEHRFAWFIMAWQIRIDRLPSFKEKIRVNTWCYNMSATLAKRAFTIEDEQGGTIVTADSLVAAYDLDRGRAGRIPASERAFVSDDPRPNLPPTKRKLSVSGEGAEVLRVPVTRRLLDSNGHVNNVQYIAIAEDAIRTRSSEFVPTNILVQYKVSAHLDDTIIAKLYEEDNGYALDLCDPTGLSFAFVRMEGRA